MNMLNRPPFPGNNLNDWARRMYEYLSSQSPVKGTVEPTAVLLPHMVDSQMPRAATEGVLLFDPASGKVKVSIGGAFVDLGPADAVVIPDLLGDVVGPIGSNELIEVNDDAGTWGDANTIPQITVDAKGRITNVVGVAVSDATLSTDIIDSTAAGRAMLTAADAAAQTALLNVFTSALKGLVPASGGLDTEYLSAGGDFEPITFFAYNPDAYNLANSAAVQKLFPLGTGSGGALTLTTGYYEFETAFTLSSMSATSGNASFSLAGTATLGNLRYGALGVDSTSVPAAASFNNSSTNGIAMAVAAATTGARAIINGVFQVTAGGTIIPSIALANAAAAVVGAGAYFKCRKIAQAGVTLVGPWT